MITTLSGICENICDLCENIYLLLCKKKEYTQKKFA